MIWLCWRQLRVQITAAGTALVGLAIYLIVFGLSLRHDHHAVSACITPTDCNQAVLALKGRYDTQLVVLNALLLVTPALLGAFIGAPLVARELETGTHRFIWAQSVTRRRWLASRLTGVILSCAAVTGVASLLLTWAAAPLDGLESRFAVITFDTRDVVPIGYAIFAATLGALVGLYCRRTLAAMAITLALFVAVQITVPILIRPHLIRSPTRTLTFNVRTTDGRPQTFLQGPDNGERYLGYTIPGAWILSRSELLNSRGQPANVTGCIDPTRSASALIDCVAAHHVHWTIRYQPANRYWTFQWIEFGGYVLVGILLAALTLWQIPRIPA